MIRSHPGSGKEDKILEEDGKAAIEAEREAQLPETKWDLYVQDKLDKNQMSEDEAQVALEASIPLLAIHHPT
jgi:superfamily I DNA and/or RNA helicase